MEYTLDYFIKKFEAIPEEAIGTTKLENHCALWHCGCQDAELDYIYTEEADALQDLLLIAYPELGKAYVVWCINDSECYVKGATPKQRMLNALNKVKEMLPPINDSVQKDLDEVMPKEEINYTAELCKQ